MMNRFKTVSAAAILSMMMATPVFAQAAVQEPGAAAFYHPDADILHGAPWHRYRSTTATLMPRWAAARTLPLVLAATVPTIRHQVPSLAMTASGICASDARRVEVKSAGRCHDPVMCGAWRIFGRFPEAGRRYLCRIEEYKNIILGTVPVFSRRPGSRAPAAARDMLPCRAVPTKSP